MDIFVPKFIQYQLYLLQLENYELRRYWKLLIKKGFFPKKNQPQRKELVWSAKAKALMLMAWALHALIIVAAGLVVLTIKPGVDNFFTVIIFTVLIIFPFYPVLFSVALLILKPLDSIAKNRIAGKAQLKIERFKDLKIVGIAGSYGKTTMKEVLRQVLCIKYNVLGTPESVNTPVGIARWILNKVDESTEIIIVEMGEHYSGDIKDICDITAPDISVITGINESHLERMKNMETVVATVFEIVSNSKQGATVMLNADDKNVMDNYKKFVWPDHKIEKFQISNFKFQIFDMEKLGWNIPFSVIARSAADEAISNQDRLPRPSAFAKASADKSDALGARNDTHGDYVFVNLLGEYALADVDAAVKIGKNLGMSNEQIIAGIKNIKPVEHRLQPMPSAANVLVIDDSYNGNPDGAEEAIKVLSRFTDRRKIYITPGLVEMGKSSAEVHRRIGSQLVGVADVVILIKNSVTGYIAEGINTTPSPTSVGATPPLQEGNTAIPRSSPPNLGGVPRQTGGGDIPKIIWFDSALKAHAELKNILKPGDVILFQNDWGDQYV